MELRRIWPPPSSMFPSMTWLDMPGGISVPEQVCNRPNRQKKAKIVTATAVVMVVGREGSQEDALASM